MRAFIAVEISEEARGAVARLQSELQSVGADVKWVEPENLHLTLKFLGEIGESQAEQLADQLKSSLVLSPFAFTLEGTGAFPKLENPRIIWAGTGAGKEQLAGLAREVEEACGRCGFPPEERPFSPHLTIGRVRSRNRVESLAQRLGSAEFKAGSPTRVEKAVLFQSTLTRSGPVYRPVREIPLKR